MCGHQLERQTSVIHLQLIKVHFTDLVHLSWTPSSCLQNQPAAMLADTSSAAATPTSISNTCLVPVSFELFNPDIKGQKGNLTCIFCSQPPE